MIKHLHLASNQRDIWNDQAAYPDSPVYNIGGSFVINGHVEYKILNRAIQQLINENETFHFVISDQTLIPKKNLNKLAFNLEFIDFSSHLSPKKEAEQWLEKEFKLPFCYGENTHLWCLALVKESDHRFYLLQKYHHVIADGWSTSVVIARTTEIYNALLYKQAIAKKSSQCYFDYITQEQKYLSSNAYQCDSQYWEKRLPSLPLPLIASRYPKSAETLLPNAHIYRLKISRDEYNEIDAFSANNESTVYHAFLTSLAIYCSRIFQREEIIIGVPSLNRSGVRFKDVFGMFVSLSPLILTISQTESIKQLMQHCKISLRELYRHHRFPLGDINKRLKLLQSGQDTLFDIVFSYEKFEYTTLYGDASVSVKQQFSGVARYPLAVTICEFSETDDVEIVFEGAENCFTAEDLQCLAEHIILILQQTSSQAEKPLNKIEWLTAKDKKIIFETFNKKNTPHVKFQSVIGLFQQQVKKQADKVILEYQNLQLTYLQLDQLSSQLALHILKQTVEPGSVIAIYLPRSLEMVISILAILKTASAYLAISHDIPDQRISHILKQSQAKILLSNRQYKKRLSPLIPHLICVDDYPVQQYDSTTVFPNIKIKPETLAYTIFTSGSSGKPKGVMINHKALSLRINWLQSLFKLKENDRMGQSIPYNFDPSIIEIFLSLSQGVCLVLVPENDYTVERFSSFIIEKKVTTLAMVPSSIRMLLQGLKYNQKTNLRIACCGGERLEPGLAKQFLQKTNADLYNVYGPTEATIIASAWKCSRHFSGKNLPIGKPADNTRIYITDKYLNILPVNVVGEIAITGDTLSKGYINQSGLTEKAFPIESINHTVFYKTGDCGYIGHDGLLYFSGRLDRQVKINGYRIELGELESVLQQHADVNLAAAIVYPNKEQKSIIAYIETTTKQADALIKELSLLLRQQLPSYMQAQKIIPLAHIQTNQTGKVNYSLLPDPEIEVIKNSKKLAAKLMEIDLLKLWKKTLLLKRIGVNDNFFELGGDSLSAVTLMIAIEKLTGTRYPISFLLDHSNIAEQAIALDKASLDNSRQIAIRLSQHQNTAHFYIVASGHGDFLRFFSLANDLGHSCSVTMLHPPETQDQTMSIHSIAQLYAASILNHNDAIFYISGFSIGGITALETARILVEKGMPPQRVILLDSIYPRWPLQSPLLFKFIKRIVDFFALNKKTINHRKLGAMLNDPGIKVQLAALPKHKIQTIESLPVDLVLTQGMWMFRPLLFSTWAKLFKKHLFRHKMSGLHGEMFQQPHLQQLTAIIKKIVISQ